MPSSTTYDIWLRLKKVERAVDDCLTMLLFLTMESLPEHKQSELANRFSKKDSLASQPEQTRAIVNAAHDGVKSAKHAYIGEDPLSDPDLLSYRAQASEHWPSCGAQDWAYDKEDGLMIFGTCTFPQGHYGRHREIAPNGVLLWEWNGPNHRAPLLR